MEYENYSFDFLRIGLAIKNSRKAQGMTRDQLAEKVNKSTRHIENIENYGKFPSVGLLFQLACMFDISLDQFIFLESSKSKSTARRNAETALDKLNDRELALIEDMAKGLYSLRKPED